MGRLATTPSTSYFPNKDKKSNNGDLAEEAIQPGGSTVKKKRRSKTEKEPDLLEDENASVEPPKKQKKRKRKDVNSVEQAKTVQKEPDTVDEPPRKKRKNRTDFSDPREDASLSGQTRKALEYAFTQLNKPKKWKFSKARQNWIIRNVWSPDLVPDSYFPLALTYLAKVQGGSREKLKEVAEGYLKPKPKTLTTKGSEINPPPESSEPPPKVKKVTFGPLIEATPKAGALTDKPLLMEAAVSVDANKADPEEVKRCRAQDVLQALESPPVS